MDISTDSSEKIIARTEKEKLEDYDKKFVHNHTKV